MSITDHGIFAFTCKPQNNKGDYEWLSEVVVV